MKISPRLKRMLSFLKKECKKEQESPASCDQNLYSNFYFNISQQQNESFDIQSCDATVKELTEENVRKITDSCGRFSTYNIGTQLRDIYQGFQMSFGQFFISTNLEWSKVIVWRQNSRCCIYYFEVWNCDNFGESYTTYWKWASWTGKIRLNFW